MKPFLSHHVNLLMLCCLLASASSTAVAQNHIRTVGAWPCATCYAVAFDSTSSGPRCYASSNNVLLVFDVSDRRQPLLLGQLAMPSQIYDLAASGDYVYVADLSDGLRIINVSNPAQPFEVAWCFTYGNARSVMVSAGRAFVADEGGYLRIVNVSEPARPWLEGALPAGSAWDVAVADSFACMVGIDNTLRVIGIGDPSAPVQRSVLSGLSPLSVAIGGPYAFVGDQVQGVLTVDVSDPALPAIVGSYPMTGWISGLALQGDRLWAAHTSSDLNLFDISVPENPRLLVQYPCAPFDVAVAGDYAFVADAGLGLRICEYCPNTGVDTVPIVSQSKVGEVRIKAVGNDIIYTVGKPGIVDVTVYNLLGNRVRQLERRYRNAGEYRWTWDGRDDAGRRTASGVYLMSLRMESEMACAKMVVVR